MLVTYDVSTITPAGRSRLRRVARACLDYGQRVQNSVFECEVEPAQWTALRARLVAEIDARQDSLRFYRLGAGGRSRIEHVGTKPILDLDGPLVFQRSARTGSDRPVLRRFASVSNPCRKTDIPGRHRVRRSTRISVGRGSRTAVDSGCMVNMLRWGRRLLTGARIETP